MRYCPKCGTMISDDSQQFCNACGASLGVPAQNTSYNNPYNNSYNTPNNNFNASMPMNWYKFLIYFGLFASAVLNAITAITALTGGQYGGMSSYVYSYYDGLQIVDILYGLLLLAIAGYAVYTRMRLAQYRADAPQCIKILYVAALGASIIYLILAAMIIGDLEITGSLVLQLIVSGAMIGANHVYFEKRKSMFVN